MRKASMRKFGVWAVASLIGALMAGGSGQAFAVPLMKGLDANNQLVVADKTFTFTSCTLTLAEGALGSPCGNISVTKRIVFGPDNLSPYDDLYGFSLGFLLSALKPGQSATLDIDYTVAVAAGSVISDAHLNQVGTKSTFVTVDEEVKRGISLMTDLHSNGTNASVNDLCFGTLDPICAAGANLAIAEQIQVRYDTLRHLFTTISIVNNLFSQAPDDGTYSTPEPITLALFGAGLLGIGAMRRRKKQTA